ncbi:tumor suppressor candidate 2-like [Dysidea avara]|uniref:tumor suppressor candidate 2-like n=1 Tax=Dysidea avara TaxID=196820 RepID=UPI003331A308
MGGYFSHKKEDSESKASGKKANQVKKVVPARAPLVNCPKYVLKRTGSMYFDADHDLAHEFYEETSIQMPGGGVKLVMRRIKHNLIPQGLIDLPHPRLHVDYPIVMAYVGPS